MSATVTSATTRLPPLLRAAAAALRNCAGAPSVCAGASALRNCAGAPNICAGASKVCAALYATKAGNKTKKKKAAKSKSPSSAMAPVRVLNVAEKNDAAKNIAALLSNGNSVRVRISAFGCSCLVVPLTLVLTCVKR